METRHRRLALAVFLFAAIVAARLVATDPADGWLFLLIAPVAIVAVEYAVAGGLFMALVASAVVLVMGITGTMDYSAFGVIVRIAAFLIAGAGVGYLTMERNRRELAIAELERKAESHREALKLNDDVVQGLAVSKMALEMGDLEKARTSLETTLASARAIATEHLTNGGSLTLDSSALVRDKAPEH